MTDRSSVFRLKFPLRLDDAVRTRLSHYGARHSEGRQRIPGLDLSLVVVVAKHVFRVGGMISAVSKLGKVKGRAPSASRRRVD